MPQITINQKIIEVPENTTILTAAESLGFKIPTMCFLKGLKPFTSCMICLVEETKSGKLLPACSALAMNGMVIETDTERVYEYRKEALELLLSEHLGDCEGPCQRICPANMNIPLMLRQIARHDFAEAIKTVKKDIALPAVLGRICPAPCENGCRRKQHDSAVSICLLKRFVADVDLAQEKPFQPECFPSSGKKVAVVGSGPAGLAAAYHLQQAGHQCFILEKEKQPGGTLRSDVSDEELSKAVLDAEIKLIENLGVQFLFKQELGKTCSLKNLQKEYDAVALTTGKMNAESFVFSDLEFSKTGIKIESQTFETNLDKIFAAGSAVRPLKMAVQAVDQGKNLAYAIDNFLQKSVHSKIDFNSQLGKLQNGEVEIFLKSAKEINRLEPAGGSVEGFSESEAVQEAERCLHCDCAKPVSCKLRKYASEYGAKQNRFKGQERKKFTQISQHTTVIYEPGKCIKCGLCVQITEKAREPLGLTFIGRGFNVQIGVPFNDSFSEALKEVAQECVSSCPTGALVFRIGKI